MKREKINQKKQFFIGFTSNINIVTSHFNRIILSNKAS